MRSLLYAIWGIIVPISLLFSQNQGIDFQDKNWADILKFAQTEGKYIFIDAYAGYCLPCKAMEKETFSQAQVGAFFNKHFISYKMDIEAGKNDYLVQIYQIKELPALLFLSPKGTLIQKVIGKQEAIPLLYLGDKTIRGGWANKEGEIAIPLKQILNDLDYYKMQYGGRVVNWAVKKQAYEQVLQSVLTKDLSLFQSTITNALKANLPDSDRFVFSMQTLFYQSIEDWESYCSVTSNYLNSKQESNPKQLNEIAWLYYLYIEDASQLQKAIKWVEKSIKIESEYYNNYTYAALLYKIGAAKKAYKIAERAFYMARARGMDDSEIIRLVKKNAKQ